MTLSDEEIAALSRTERRDLIERLQRPASDFVPAHPRAARAVRLGLMIGGAVVLIPWILVLAATLPSHYVAQNWKLTWVGFDALLALLMGLTAYCGWRRKQLVLPISFATGVLLVCDAWFDVVTASPFDRNEALASAFLAELPLAFIMIRGSLRLLRVSAVRSYQLADGQSMWHLQFPTSWVEARRRGRAREHTR